MVDGKGSVDPLPSTTNLIKKERQVMKDKEEIRKNLIRVITEDASERNIDIHPFVTIRDYLSDYHADMSPYRAELVNLIFAEWKLVIGAREDDYLSEMAAIWDPETHQGLDMVVYGDSEPVPHFHLVGPDILFNRDKGLPADTCIRLDEPTYFHHGKHAGLLSSDGKKLLVEYLGEISRSDPGSGINNWQIAAVAWNLYNPDSLMISAKLKDMPDYAQL